MSPDIVERGFKLIVSLTIGYRLLEHQLCTAPFIPIWANHWLTLYSYRTQLRNKPVSKKLAVTVRQKCC